MSKFSKKLIVGSLAIIMLGVISWSFYFLINKSAEDGLRHFRIVNPYLQSIIVIVIGALGLVLLGWKGKKIWEGIISK